MKTIRETTDIDKSQSRLSIAHVLRLEVKPECDPFTIIAMYGLTDMTTSTVEQRESGDEVKFQLLTSRSVWVDLLKMQKPISPLSDIHVTKITLKHHPNISAKIHVGGFYPAEIQLTLMDKQFWYECYLQSDNWIMLRNRLLGQRGFMCELCTSSKNLQLHHITYENLGDERDSDVMVLCGKCHEKAHRI